MQAVESASLPHLSFVSISKQLVKTNITLNTRPYCGGGGGQGIKHTHVHTSSFWLCKHTVTSHTPFWMEPQSLWFWLHKMPLVKRSYFSAAYGVWFQIVGGAPGPSLWCLCTLLAHTLSSLPSWVRRPSQQQGAQMGIFSQTLLSRAKIFPGRGKKMIFPHRWLHLSVRQLFDMLHFSVVNELSDVSPG